MKVIKTVRELKQAVSELKQAGKVVGLVPTMGALHAGHMSLVDRARRENDVVVVSVFVNPTQYGRAGLPNAGSSRLRHRVYADG